MSYAEDMGYYDHDVEAEVAERRRKRHLARAKHQEEMIKIWGKPKQDEENVLP